MVGEDPRLFAVNQAPPAALRSPSGSPASTVERTGIDLTFPFRGLRRLRDLVGGASSAAASSATTAAGTTASVRGRRDRDRLVGHDRPRHDAGPAADGDGDADADSRGEPQGAGGRLRRWWATTDRSFFVWGVASYLIVLGVVLALSLRQSDGHLVYVLDDPAIHQSVASNLLHHGTWGVVPGHFESASSSPLWTIVLAGYLILPVPASSAPLLLNMAAAVAVIAILGAEPDGAAAGRRRPADAVAVTLLVAVVLFLPGLTLVGMEHTLHMATVLGGGRAVPPAGDGRAGALGPVAPLRAAGAGDVRAARDRVRRPGGGRRPDGAVRAPGRGPTRRGARAATVIEAGLTGLAGAVPMASSPSATTSAARAGCPTRCWPRAGVERPRQVGVPDGHRAVHQRSARRRPDRGPARRARPGGRPPAGSRSRPSVA